MPTAPRFRPWFTPIAEDASPTPRKSATPMPSSTTQSIHKNDQANSGDSLAERIRQRIANRLGSRIRRLEVAVKGKQVYLSGECSTYYSKQLAQQAALGVIEDETLENSIRVG